MRLGRNGGASETFPNPSTLVSSPRLTIFVSSVFLAESAFYQVVPPLVPVFVAQTHMTTTEVGVLVAAYPAGILIAAIPAMALVARRGVRATTIVGLGLLVAATLGFAWSTTPALLDAARLIQGIGGAVAWAGALAWLTSVTSADRRASAIGGAVGTALIGMVIGPPIGAVAAEMGRGPVFSSLAVALALMALATPAAPAASALSEGLMRALAVLVRKGRAVLGSGLLSVIGVVNGTVASLVPLLVARDRGSSSVIAIVFVGSYFLAASWNVLLGRVADRIGRLIPVITGFVVTAALLPVLPTIGLLAPLTVTAVLAASVVSGLWTPTAAMVTDVAEPGPSGHAVAIATMNAAWAAGGAVGSIALSGLADKLGFVPSFALAGVLCGLAAVVSGAAYLSSGGSDQWSLGKSADRSTNRVGANLPREAPESNPNRPILPPF
jgi:MFS family permease